MLGANFNDASELTKTCPGRETLRIFKLSFRTPERECVGESEMLEFLNCLVIGFVLRCRLEESSYFTYHLFLLKLTGLK